MSSLQILFIISLLIINIQGRTLSSKQISQISEDCIVSTNVDRALVKQALLLKIPSHPKYKEYLFCSYKKQGYQTESGEIVHEELKNFLKLFYSVADTEYIVDTCKGISFEDPKETTFATLKCILKKIFKLEKLKVEPTFEE